MATPARDPQRESGYDDSLFRAFLLNACPHSALPASDTPTSLAQVEVALSALRHGRASDDSYLALRGALEAEDGASRLVATQGLLGLFPAQAPARTPKVVPQALVEISFDAIAHSAVSRVKNGDIGSRPSADQSLLTWGARLLSDGGRERWLAARQMLGEHRAPEVRLALVDLLDRVFGGDNAPGMVWETADTLIADRTASVRLATAAALLRHADVLMLGLQVPQSELQRCMHILTEDLIAYGERLPQFSLPVFEALFQDFHRAFTEYVIKYPENSGAPELCQAALDTFWTIRTLARAGAWETLLSRSQIAITDIDRVYATACEGARVFGSRMEAESASGAAVLDRPAPGSADYTFAIGRAVTPATSERITQLSRAFQIVGRVEGWLPGSVSQRPVDAQVLTGYLGRHLVRASLPKHGLPSVDLYLAGAHPEHLSIEQPGTLPLADLIQRRYRKQLHA